MFLLISDVTVGEVCGALLRF